MPFKSMAQMRYMFKNTPEIARRWAHEYGVPQNLPERIGKKKDKKKRRK